MGLTYFKRYRMEIALQGRHLPPEDLPPGYEFLPWDPALVGAHAEAKFNSFCCELDANVFPCLGDRAGCRRLMNEISHKPGFLPQATWLLACRRNGSSAAEYCGTIQGVRDEQRGWIQNIGIVPAHRGRGLGRRLILRSLAGFRAAGLHRVYLEVTAQNQAAIRLYQRLGFAKVRTVYKAIELADVCVRD